jgi:Undecaprenyl-phosphate glucose phosphotransferase
MTADSSPKPEKHSEKSLQRAIKVAEKLGFKDANTQSPNWMTLRFATYLVRFFEILAIAVAGYSTWLYTHLTENYGVNAAYLALVLLIGLLAPLIFQPMGLYRYAHLTSKTSHIGRLMAGWGLLFGSTLLLFYVVGNVIVEDQLFLTRWAAMALFALIITRFFTGSLLRYFVSTGVLLQRAVIIGGDKAGSDVIAALQSSQDTGIEIVGIFDDRDDKRSPKNTRGLKKMGKIDDLVAFAREVRVDLLIVTLPLSAEKRLMEMLKKLWVLPVDIKLAGQVNKLRFTPKAYSYIGNVPFLDLFDRPLSEWNHIIKSIEDRVIAAIALVLLSPIMLITALLIKMDSKGPVLFKQDRYGFNNNLIGVYKFRSMYTDMSDVKADKLVTKDDPRVTKIGRFIRKTSIDELPQLFNVLKGELSLVGPRPHALSAKAADRLYYDVVDGYFARHKMKPGITGWAQVNGWRGETDTKEKIQRRVDHDLHYIENWSIWFDLYILAITPYSLLNTENAY